MFEKLMCAILRTNVWLRQKLQYRMHAIAESLDHVYSPLDKQQSTIAVYLYFSKAFDTVNYDILMSKLLHNGIRGVTENNMSQSKTPAPLCQTLH